MVPLNTANVFLEDLIYQLEISRFYFLHYVTLTKNFKSTQVFGNTTYYYYFI